MPTVPQVIAALEHLRIAIDLLFEDEPSFVTLWVATRVRERRYRGTFYFRPRHHDRLLREYVPQSVTRTEALEHPVET